MRSTMLGAVLIGLTMLFLSNPAAAQVGEWTKCIAWSKNVKFNIVYGAWSVDTCFALAQSCTEDPLVRSQYYSNPTIIEPPYKRCTIRWNWTGQGPEEVQTSDFEPQNAFCRANCQREAAQCYRTCEGSSDFMKCTDRCVEEWGRCEDACKNVAPRQ